MQSRFLTARIESTLTLAVGALSVAFIAAGTLGMGRSFDPRHDTVAVAAPLERVVITGQRSPANTTAPTAEARHARQGV